MRKDHPREGFSILFIVPTDYASLLEKGVASMILERDEGGFFKRVISVHPYATKTQSISLNETHQLIEFGPDYPFTFLNFRGGGLLNYFFKPIPIIKKLSQLVKKEHINLIRATDPYWCGFIAWAVSKWTGIPFCISIHTDYDKFYSQIGRKKGKPLLFKLFEKFVLPRTPLVMPIREHLVSDTLRKGADPSAIRVIPHGITMEEFSSKGIEDIFLKYGISAEKKVISFVGRLSKDNYVYDIIEVIRRISIMRNDFVVLLVGDGAERDKLKSLVQEYGLLSTVIFTGFQPNGVAISIRRKSLMALCLKGGFSLIESCAAGCPPISYDIEWHDELVKSGETGFLIKENDLDGLVEAIVYLLNNLEEAKAMGARARDRAIARHNISNTSEMKINCYRELLRRNTC